MTGNSVKRPRTGFLTDNQLYEMCLFHLNCLEYLELASTDFWIMMVLYEHYELSWFHNNQDF